MVTMATRKYVNSPVSSQNELKFATVIKLWYISHHIKFEFHGTQN